METGPFDPRQMGQLRELFDKLLSERLPNVTIGSDEHSVLTPVYPPLGSVPERARFLAARDYVLSFASIAAGITQPLPLNINDPSMIYAVSASGRVIQSNADAPLRGFEWNMQANDDRYVSAPVLLSNFAGTPGLPRLVAGRGWSFYNLSQVVCTLSNLSADVSRVDVTFHALLFRL